MRAADCLARTLIGVIVGLGAQFAYADEAPVEAPAHDLRLGPVSIAFGPQENGEFGVVLTGGDAIKLDSFRAGRKPPYPHSGRFWSYYSTIEYALDGAWSGQDDALNQATISLKPQLTFVRMNAVERVTVYEQSESEAYCNDLADRATRQGDTLSPELLAEFANSCGEIGGIPRQTAAIGLVADALYRYGRFEIDGARYQANQFLAGIGLRVFAPGATRHRAFRENPRVTVTYYSVTDSSRSNVPLPETIEADQIDIDSKLRLRLPMPGRPWSNSPLHLDVDLRASRPTSGARKDWESFGTAQLSLNVGESWKPAIVYRTGNDKGLEYDRQLILGFLMELL